MKSWVYSLQRRCILYTDILCPLGCGDVDTLQNVLTCSVLKQYHTSKEVTDRNVEYNDIYSEDIFKQQKVTHFVVDNRNKLGLSCSEPRSPLISRHI